MLLDKRKTKKTMDKNDHCGAGKKAYFIWLSLHKGK